MALDPAFAADWVYTDDHHNGNAAELINGGNPGRGNIGMKPSFGFINATDSRDPAVYMQFAFDYYQVQGGRVLATSCNRVFINEENFQEYGPFFDREDFSHKEWIYGSTHWAESPRDSGHESDISMFITEPDATLVDSFGRKYVAASDFIGSLQDYGKLLSAAHTLKLSVQEYLASPEGQRFLEQYPTEAPGYIGATEEDTADGEGRVIYGISTARNGKPIIFTGTDISEYLSLRGEKFGLPLEKMKNRGILEELMHLYRKSHKRVNSLTSLVNEEIATKMDLIEFYQSCLDDATSSSEREYYSALISEVEDDIATINRYEKIFERQSKRSKSRKSSLESIVEEGSEERVESDVEGESFIEPDSEYDGDAHDTTYVSGDVDEPEPDVDSDVESDGVEGDVAEEGAPAESGE